jgi:hypothetical protein
VGVFFVLMSVATISHLLTRQRTPLGRFERAIAPLGYASLGAACVAGSLYAVREIDAIL